MNLRKCKFLRAWVKVLGLDVGWQTCVLADKSLKKWLQVALPRTIRELQSILGMLLWAS